MTDLKRFAPILCRGGLEKALQEAEKYFYKPLDKGEIKELIDHYFKPVLNE